MAKEGKSKAGEGAVSTGAQSVRKSVLRKKYESEVVSALMEEFKYQSSMQVPRIEKITVNMGLGEAVSNPNLVKTCVEELTLITGQRAMVTKSKKAIANFKLRAGLGIGCMVTLRRERMWEFLERLLTVALPRVRDFKGVNGRAFDGRGNYNLGLKEQVIFPEISYEKVLKIVGMNVTITTTAQTDAECKALLKHLGMPFRN
jgi:large subunit ribosomal protein L5